MTTSTTMQLANEDLRHGRDGERKPKPGRSTARRKAVAASRGDRA